MSTIDAKEINQFERLAHTWWDEQGPYKILHQLNPVRLNYLKTQICEHFHLDAQNPQSLSGLKILDIGCGGGLVSIPMARMGAEILGIDACTTTIAAAQHHTNTVNSPSQFRHSSAEDLATTMAESFDVVLALEIIEHVQDPQEFVAVCSQLLRPGGILIFSTLTRTFQSFLLGIVAAEYILRWVPKGTHTWQKFIQPAELSAWLAEHHFQTRDISGMNLDILKQRWEIKNGQVKTNYFLTATQTP